MGWDTLINRIDQERGRLIDLRARLYERYTTAMRKKASILDEPRNTLDQAVWDVSGEAPKLNRKQPNGIQI